MNKTPRTMDELYPSFVGAADLEQTRAYTLTIDRVYFSEFHENPYNKNSPLELCAVLVFKQAKKHLILNKEKTEELSDAAQTRNYNDLPGKKITLSLTPGRNGKDRVKISAPNSADILFSSAQEEAPTAEAKPHTPRPAEEEAPPAEAKPLEKDYGIEEANDDLF